MKSKIQNRNTEISWALSTSKSGIRWLHWRKKLVRVTISSKSSGSSGEEKSSLMFSSGSAGSGSSSEIFSSTTGSAGGISAVGCSSVAVVQGP